MPNSQRTGYTLIELIITVAVIGIVTAMAIPRIRLSSYRADSAMRTVQVVLQQAQRRAVTRQSEVMVSFDTARGRIRTVFDANGNHIADPGEEFHWRPLEDGNRFAVPPGGVQTTGGAPVVGGSLSSRDGYPTIFYHRDGAASSELEVFICSSLQEKRDFRALHLRQATGRIQLYRYTGTTWLGVGL